MKLAPFAFFGAVFLLGPLLVRTAADVDAEDDGSTPLDYINPLGALERLQDHHRTEQAMRDDNMRAFLALIAYAEGTDRRADPYRVCYGYRHTIADLAEHPAVSGEWRGERLPDAMCQAAGFGPGCVSTAAGRYQLIKPTWLRVRRAIDLPDFGPLSQDKACAYLIDEAGASGDVYSGRVEQAIGKVKRIWASLPGSGWQQGERRLAELLDAYGNAGGVFA